MSAASTEDIIRTALDAIEIAADGGFWWCGERADWYPPRLLTNLSTAERRELTLSCIADCLYDNFYRCGEVRPLPPPTDTELCAPDPILGRRLAEANTGSGSWQGEWVALTADSSGRCRVRRNGLTLTATPSDVRQTGYKDAQVRRPTNMYTLSPGFFTANLDAAHPTAVLPARLYWHVTAAGAASFVNVVTSQCNRAGIGGTLKVINDRAQPDRCDSAVVYLPLSDVLAHHDLFTSIHRELRPVLRPETPAMTMKLAAGLAIAEDPGVGLSYGQHRCRLIAQAALRIHDTPPTRGAASTHLVDVFEAVAAG